MLDYLRFCLRLLSARLRSPKARSRARLRDLLVWERQLPGVKNAVLPGHDGRTNPALAGESLYVAAFSPGAVFALNASDGSIRWSAPLGRLGPSSVEVRGDTVFAKTAHEVFGLSAANGATRWSCCPLGRDHEWIYANPVHFGGKLAFGDRTGVVRALDAQSGAVVWTTKVGRQQINATGASDGQSVYTATNGAEAVALDAATGAIIWRRTIDGPSIYSPQLVGDLVIVRTRRALHALNRDNGSPMHSWRTAGRIRAAIGVGDCVLVLSQTSDAASLSALIAPGELHLWKPGSAHRSWSYPPSGGADPLVRSAETGLVYDCRMRGLGILDARTAERLSEIDDVTLIGLVSASSSAIFSLDFGGVVRRLRHPQI